MSIGQRATGDKGGEPGLPDRVSVAPDAQTEQVGGGDVGRRGDALFRLEALGELEGSQYGERLEASHLNSRVAAVCAMLVVVGIVCLGMLGTVSKHSRLPGFITNGGLADVVAPSAGALQRRLVAEGAQVSKGEPLLEIATDLQTSGGRVGDQVDASLQLRRQAMQDEVLSAGARWQRLADGVSGRRSAITEQLALAEREQELATRAAALQKELQLRDQRLAMDGFMSGASVKDREALVLQAEGAAARAQRQVTQLRTSLAELDMELERLRQERSRDELQLRSNVAALSAELAGNQARRSVTVLSPGDGVVSFTAALEAGAIAQGQSVATVALGSTGYMAELYGPSRSVGLIQPGQVVWLRYPAYPYEKFGLQRAVVESISATPVRAGAMPGGRERSLQVAAQTSEPLYRVGVRVEGRLQGADRDLPIAPGMSVEGDVVYQRVKVWEFIFEPVLRAVRRMNKE